jgi:branched-chain amino acid transport system permease protein
VSDVLAAGASRTTLVRPLALVLGWLLLLTLLPAVLDEYYLGLAVTVGINALLALGLVMVTGLGGQFSLAQAAFFGLGAYGSGLLTVKFGWSAGLALVASAAVATAMAYLLGKPIFRLRGHFLAMGTLALTEIFFVLVSNLDVTGGSSGFGGIAPLSLLGVEFSALNAQLWLVGLVLGAGIWAVSNIKNGREGRALRALRSHEAAAASCGVNISWSKTRMFAGSAFIGSLAGSLYAHQLLYINPAPFGVLRSIDVLSIAVLGGLLSPWGALIGAVAYEGIRQGVDGFLPTLFGEDAVGAGGTLVFGLILVLVLIARPDGLAGTIASLWHLLTRRVGALERLGIARPGSTPAAQPTPVAPRAVADARPTDRVVLQAHGLSKVFGGVRAVTEVDLVLHEREILAVIGPNGAGKSTLLNLLSGILTPSAGRVALMGEDVTRAPAHAVAAYGLARTFQTPSLFAGMQTRENVLVGAYLRGRTGLIRGAIPTRAALREEKRLGERADAILRDLGLSHLSAARATELSLGQQKLVEVARALAHEPVVLLMDEPCAGLNRVEKLALADTIRELRAGGISVLLIEHDMEFVMSLADRVHVLDFGRTLRVGTPAQVQKDPDVIAAYLGTPHDPPRSTEEALSRGHA